MLRKHKVNVKILMKLLVIGGIIISQVPSEAAACCYAPLPACVGSCSLGSNCIPIVTSLPPLSGVLDTNGYKKSTIDCGRCVKGIIVIGTCGPKLAGESC